MSNYCKNWCFTVNNFTEEDVVKIKALIESDCKYGVFQREQGESGTPHLQGYLSLKERKRLAFLKENVHATAHFEAAKGTAKQNREYCSKPGGTDLYEFGEVSGGQGMRSDLGPVVAAILGKRKLADVAEEFPIEYIKYYKGIEALQSRLDGRRDFKTDVYWFYGATGTGKSREAASLAGGAYYKMATNKWWDGYDGHEDVIIDDYRRDFCTFGELLRLFDRYPLTIETKGGTRPFLAKRIFITTPKNPIDTWEGRTSEDIEQLMRRITEVKHFNDLFKV